MQVAQRGTSQSGIGNSEGFVVDRFRLPTGASSGTWTLSQESDGPDGYAKSLKALVTATGSTGGSNYAIFRYKFEGQELQHLKYGTSGAEQITLSFWFKTNKTGTYQVTLRNTNSSRMVGATYTVSSADTWEQKTITFPADTTGSFADNNTDNLRMDWWLHSGANFNSGTVPTTWQTYDATNQGAGLTVDLADTINNYAQITGVKLEVGSVATEFDHRSYAEEFAACERYYHKWVAQELYANIAIGYSAGSATGRAVYYLPTTMRTTPSLSSGGSFRCINDGGTYGGSVNSISIQRNHTKTPFIQFTTSVTNLPSGDYQPVEMGADNDADAYIDFDAEL
jgi:hypothetical protein